MRVIPVLDLMGGQAVHARRGDRSNYRPVKSLLAPGTADPVRLAAAYRQAGYEELYVADLDAIMGTGNHLETVAAIVRSTGMRVMVDSGLRRASDAGPLLAAGAAAVVAGSETLAGWEEVATLTGGAGPDRVVFSLDMRGGTVLTANPGQAGATPEEWLARVTGTGVRTITLIELQAVGSEGGPPLALAERLARAAPEVALLVGGGVRDAVDLQRLRHAGVAGALVGTALHNGSLGTGPGLHAERSGGPVTAADAIATPADRVVINGMQFFGRHGVYRHETENGQVFVVDVELALDLRPAGVTDLLARTVDYGEVCADVRAVLEGPRVQLIETLAERVATRLLAHFRQIDAVTVRIHKPQAPIPLAFSDIAVEIRRRRTW